MQRKDTCCIIKSNNKWHRGEGKVSESQLKNYKKPIRPLNHLHSMTQPSQHWASQKEVGGSHYIGTRVYESGPEQYV